VLFGLFGLFIGWISDASAQPAYYADLTASGNYGMGSNAGETNAACTTCHDAAVPTCNGCHAHGTHSSNGKNDINILASTDKSAYTSNETITITITGGYNPGGTPTPNWIRATVDQGAIRLNISSGPCDTPGDADNNCGGGNGYPITLTVAASTLGTGVQMLTASWYGHVFDLATPVRGDGTNGSTFVSDGLNNPNHGFEVVTISSFTISDPDVGDAIIAAAKKSGGGSLSWPIIALLLFVVIAMLVRDRSVKLIPIKRDKE